MLKKNSFKEELFYSMPSFVWLLVFFFIPTLIVLAFAFKKSDPFGGVLDGWTLETIYSLANINNVILICRTLWLSLLTTIVCLALALPAGYCMALAKPQMRNLLLFLIIVPFWSSFLIRIFAWKSFLHPEGFFKEFLVFFKLISPETSLLYNSNAVLLVMIYTYLPFAILPIYAAAAKFDFQFMEAAQDLGATRTAAFFKIFLPGISKGILSAIVMVFVPAIGAYVIPDLVGGTQSEMIGNKIAQKTLIEKNLPLASALSALTLLIVLLPTIIILFFQKRAKKFTSEADSKE